MGDGKTKREIFLKRLYAVLDVLSDSIVFITLAYFIACLKYAFRPDSFARLLIKVSNILLLTWLLVKLEHRIPNAMLRFAVLILNITAPVVIFLIFGYLEIIPEFKAIT